MDNYKDLLVTKNGAILEVVLNRPEARNAITADMDRHWDEALDVAERDPEVKVVTLRGAGPVFSTGHDLKAGAAREPSATPLRAIPSLPRAWYFPKPIIAGVHGYIGPHANAMLTYCDFIIAADGTKFSFEQTRMGNANPATQAPPLAMLLPMRALKKLYMMGGWMDAQQALQYQYVQRVVPLAKLEEEMKKWAEHICKVPPEAIQSTKQSIHRMYEIMGLAGIVGVEDRGNRPPTAERGEFSQIVSEKGLREALKFRDSQFDQEVIRL